MSSVIAASNSRMTSSSRVVSMAWAGSAAPDRGRNLLDLFERASGDQDIPVIGGVAAAQRCPKTIIGTDSHNDGLGGWRLFLEGLRHFILLHSQCSRDRRLTSQCRS